MLGDADQGWGAYYEIPLHSYLALPDDLLSQQFPVYALPKHHLGKKKSPKGRKAIVTWPKFEMQVPRVLEKEIGVCKLKKIHNNHLWELVL